MKRKPPLLDKRYAKHRALLPEEAELWRAEIEGRRVEKSVPVPKNNTPSPARKKTAQTPTVHLLDKPTLAKLKRGSLSIGARLDLHGFTRETAYTELARFVEALAGRGVKTALVITGKGGNSPGTLRSLMPFWLEETPLREHIIAYDKAAPHHGGEGAWYLRIRKRK